VRITLVLFSLFTVLDAHAATVVDELLAGYQSAGAPLFDAKWAETMWTKKFPVPKDEAGAERSCSTCHTTDLKAPGKHATTSKVIDPLAPSVNKERLTDAKNIEKWFKRNCTWVLSRECTPQEKAGFLQFIRNQ
jgi:hypothetical protein